MISNFIVLNPHNHAISDWTTCKPEIEVHLIPLSQAGIVTCFCHAGCYVVSGNIMTTQFMILQR